MNKGIQHVYANSGILEYRDLWLMINDYHKINYWILKDHVYDYIENCLNDCIQNLSSLEFDELYKLLNQ